MWTPQIPYTTKNKEENYYLKSSAIFTRTETMSNNKIVKQSPGKIILSPTLWMRASMFLHVYSTKNFQEYPMGISMFKL